MPKPTKGKRLGGSPSHEDQIISNLISALIQHEKIETTVTKAKTVKPYAEKMITKAKKGSLHDRRQVLKTIQDKSVVAKLFEEIAPKYEDRDGGYTRIIKAGFRYGDNAPMAIIEFVDRDIEARRIDKKKKETSKETENKEDKKVATAG